MSGGRLPPRLLVPNWGLDDDFAAREAVGYRYSPCGGRGVRGRACGRAERERRGFRDPVAGREPGAASLSARCRTRVRGGCRGGDLGPGGQGTAQVYRRREVM